jgi:hypothetical protein
VTAANSTRRIDGWALLIEAIGDLVSEQPELLEYEPDEVELDGVHRDPDNVVVDDRGSAVFAVLLAEAFARVSQEVHKPGDQALMVGSEWPEPAIVRVLVEECGGIRHAPTITGISKATLARAMQRKPTTAPRKPTWRAVRLTADDLASMEVAA